MFKTHQKISGCFKSLNMANDYAFIRSYASTCSRREIKAFDVLIVLFSKRLLSIMADNANEALRMAA